MQTDERDQSRERGRQESAEYDSWSSGLQTRETSTSDSQRRNGKGREIPVWYEGENYFTRKFSVDFVILDSRTENFVIQPMARLRRSHHNLHQKATIRQEPTKISR